MSRINRIRIVNLNYNHNAIRIDDECFDLVNENTLLSLRNGEENPYYSNDYGTFCS